MKRKELYAIFILVNLLSVKLIAQETSRFPIQPTSVWRINYEYACSGETFVRENGDQEYKYFVDGDTLINDKTYFKLYKTGIMYLDVPVPVTNKYMGAIRDSSNRFFWVEDKLDSEKLLYNFDAQPGESICPDCNGMDYIVGDVVTLDNGRKKFYIDIITVHCGSANALVEGIGWLGGLLEGNACYAHPGIRGSYLFCYSENGVSEYESEGYHRCGEKMNCNTDITSTKKWYYNINPEISYLTGGQIEICVEGISTGLCNIEIFTIDGKKMKYAFGELPLIVDTSDLKKGSYVLKLTIGGKNGITKFVAK